MLGKEAVLCPVTVNRFFVYCNNWREGLPTFVPKHLEYLNLYGKYKLVIMHTHDLPLSLSHSISFVVCLLACPLLYLPLWLLLLLMSVCGSCTHSLSVSVCISIFYMYTECIRLSSVCLPINLSTFFVCTVSQSVSCIGTSDCMKF